MSRNYYSIYFNLLFLLAIFIQNSLSKKQSLVLPYTIYRLPINEKTTKEEIYQSFEKYYFYTLLEIGNPQKKIPIVYHFNDSYLTLNSDMNFAYILNSNYNPINSKTFKNLGQNLVVEDLIFNINNEETTKNFILSFKSNIKNPQNFYIYLGLQNFYMQNYKKSIPRAYFLDQLKTLGLIDYISFSINQTSEIEGFININLEPYEFAPDLYSKKDRYTSLIRGVESRIINKEAGEYLWSLEITLVYYKNRENKIISVNIDHYELNEDQYAVLLNPAYGLIKGPYEFKNLIQKDFFNYFIKNDICSSSKVNRLFFFYCNANYKDKLKDEFPPINFYHQELDYTYILDFEDLFIEKNGILYFLICYDNIIFGDDKFAQISEWVLGKPFFNKYQFSFDVEGKKINFYLNKNGYPKRNIIKVKDEYLNKTINYSKLNELNKNRNYVNKLLPLKNLCFIVLSMFIIFISFFCIAYNLRVHHKKIVDKKRKGNLDEDKGNVELKETLDDGNS